MVCTPAGIRPARGDHQRSSSTAGGSSRLARCSAGSANTRSGPRSRSASANAVAACRDAWSPATPSLSHTSSASPSVSCRNSSSAAARSTGHGLGCQLGTICTASAALRRRRGAAPGSGAVPSRTTSRFCRWARPAKRSSASVRRAQPGAAAQPSSTTSTSGPSPVSSGSGLSTGPASARIRSVASTRRRTRSQSGVRAEVSSSGSRPSRKRTAGKRISLGAGGMTRSSHHSTGRLTSAASSQGLAKPSRPRSSIV